MMLTDRSQFAAAMPGPGNQSPSTAKHEEIEAALEAAIDPWLAHMRWRRDFEEWRAGRLWQEKKQQGTLNHLRAFLHPAGAANGFGKGKSSQAAKTLEPFANRSILDLGCGMGGLATALALAGARVQALDFNSQYCRITQLRGRRYSLDLSPVNATGEALPFRDAQFDVIVCLDVLEHVEDPEKLLSEISRCLKPGGLVHLTAINRFAFRDPHYHVRFVNWLPRRMAAFYLRSIGRVKDNSSFADRQTLAEMHYYRYGQLKKLFARHELSEPCDAAEMKLNNDLSGWKRLLQRAGLLRLTYKTYRSFYKSTYAVMATKNGLRDLCDA